MLIALYNFLVLAFVIVSLPKAIYESIRHGKYRESFWKKLGIDSQFKRLDFSGDLVWVHAVSVGEVRAVSSVVKKLHSQNPDLKFLISTVTETGQAEAKKLMPFALYFCYLPIDLSWVMRKKLKMSKPKALLICETDFWLNFVQEAKDLGVKVALINGKISDRSFRRFQKFHFFSKKLFKNFDLFCMQNKEYKEKFLGMGIPKEKVHITGNLKFDVEIPYLKEDEKKIWQDRLGGWDKKIITAGSTHEGEESLILEKFLSLSNDDLLLILVPRHPERFISVAAFLKQMSVPFIKWSDAAKCTKDTKVLLLDTMGKLLNAYELSTLAIVAGSFVPGIGGHNICEPGYYGVPSIFGPYTHDQRELVELTAQYHAGVQVKADKLEDTLKDLLALEHKRDEMGQNGSSLTREMKGSSQRTIDQLYSSKILSSENFQSF